MSKAKLETNVCCNVCACKYNVDGKLCKRENIDITNDEKIETAHFCGSYCECGCNEKE